MKAVTFGQKFICFSFVIKDSKCVVNISEAYGSNSYFQSKISIVIH